MAKNTAAAAAHETPAPAAMTAPAPAQTEGTAPADFITIEIADMSVNLPVKFRPGHVLTENQAKILDAAYQRQFTNNQNANAKARAERLKNAKTDAERADNAPWTAAQYAAEYVDYEPSVGGAVRGSSLEKLRHEVAWKFWTQLVNAHNAAVTSGAAPVIARAGAKQVTIATPPRRAKGQAEADAKAAREAFDTERSLFIGRLLDHGTYGPQIAALVDAELAARKSPVVKTDGVDVIVSDGALID